MGLRVVFTVLFLLPLSIARMMRSSQRVQAIRGKSDGCVLGEVCRSVYHCGAYDQPCMVCGGELCPAAAGLWDATNMKMHHGMAINFTGHPDIDFVRGMIPHHKGAIDMCANLVLTLSCLSFELHADALDGLVRFCALVTLAQETEIQEMQDWLAERGLSETSSCMMSMEGTVGMGCMMRTDPCGNTTATSSVHFIHVNHVMHNGMTVKLSCDHSVDFVRMMIPHHAGAVAMCSVLQPYAVDAFVTKLCANIERTQKAEIEWMHEWLEQRKVREVAPCETAH
jgi:uncharacterized protein (DUF305 family)